MDDYADESHWPRTVAILAGVALVIVMYGHRLNGGKILSYDESNGIKEQVFKLLFPSSPLASGGNGYGTNWYPIHEAVNTSLETVRGMDKIYVLPIVVYVPTVYIIWAMEKLMSWLVIFIIGLFIKHPVEEEAKKWKRKKGMPLVLDFKAIVRKMYDRKEGILPGYDSWIKKERIEKLGKRLDAEKEFMGKVEDHERRRRGMKKDK